MLLLVCFLRNFMVKCISITRKFPNRISASYLNNTKTYNQFKYDFINFFLGFEAKKYRI